MMTRTHHEVNYSDISVCVIVMTITGSLSQMLDDTKRVSEMIPIGIKLMMQDIWRGKGATVIFRGVGSKTCKYFRLLSGTQVYSRLFRIWI